MIKNRSQTAHVSRIHQDSGINLANVRIHRTNIANIHPVSPLAVSRKHLVSKGNVKSNNRLYMRAKSAPPGSSSHHSSNILDIRGKNFDQNGKAFDMISYLKGKSFPRRIQRLINEAPTKRTENNTDNSSSLPTEEKDTEDVASTGQISLNNKQLLERRRGLYRQRSMNRSGVS